MCTIKIYVREGNVTKTYAFSSRKKQTASKFAAWNRPHPPNVGEKLFAKFLVLFFVFFRVFLVQFLQIFSPSAHHGTS